MTSNFFNEILALGARVHYMYIPQNPVFVQFIFQIDQSYIFLQTYLKFFELFLDIHM